MGLIEVEHFDAVVIYKVANLKKLFNIYFNM